ncbi:MAG: MobF family relaxase [Actinomycetes bacterium]
MSMARLSAGAGYRYLLRHTAAGDVELPGSTPLAEYYAATGYPPGRWLGSGLAGLANGEGLAPGTVVTEEALAALYAGQDPVTARQLGRATPTYAATDGQRSSHAVAGFDLTLTAPKSVSVLWAMADEPTRVLIAQAHHQAVASMLEFLEERVASTRVGHAGAQSMRVRGLIAAAFDHCDTRAGDPNLHTHLVIANKVQGVDGKWRSLDGRRLHKAAVAVSELYDDLVADRLAAVLPVVWSHRDRGRSRTPAFEVDGLNDALLAEFSQRSNQVTARTRELAESFRTEHGRCPSRVEQTRLAQRACRDTRPAKIPHALPDLLADWRQRARVRTGRSPHELATAAVAGRKVRPVLAKDVDGETLQQLARDTVAGVQARRTTWDRWNLHAEASRVTRGIRMAGPGERIHLTDLIVAAATEHCVAIDGPPAASRAATAPSWPETRYTSRQILDAEQFLLAANADADDNRLALPSATAATAAAMAVRDGSGGKILILATDQRAAVVGVTTSGRQVEVLVGPAGTGKTATLAVIRRAWEETHGRGSVVGLAPSAVAAGELASALQLRCETTAKWLWETNGQGGIDRETTRANLRERCVDAYGRGDRRTALAAADAMRRVEAEQQHWRLRPGQLVIVDEAAMSGTLDLAALSTQAKQAGAKVLLVGDHRQLGSVSAGGAFGLLARHGHATSLDGLWRFSERWEATATRQLRDGDSACVDTYTQRGRVTGGDHDTMIDNAHGAWVADRAVGRRSLMIAADNGTVAELNDRARASRLNAGQVADTGVELRDGTTAGVGDLVITRENQRRVRTTDGNWVRNGDTWRVTATHTDGSITVTSSRHERDASRGGTIRLDPDYVAAHVQLGYAVTAHRAQGATVDTCHVVATPAMTREAFYVAMTRGRHENRAYVSTGPMIDKEDHQDFTQPIMPAELLRGVLANEGTERSATEQLQQRCLDAGLAGPEPRPAPIWPRYDVRPQRQRAMSAPEMQR